MGRKKAKHIPNAKIWFECECGHKQEVDFYDSKMVHLTDGYIDADSGTSWPAQLTITCPSCGGEKDFL